MGILGAIFSVLIPGTGLLRRRRYLLGTAVLVAFLLFLQVYVLLEAIEPADAPDYAGPAALACFGLIAAANVVFELFYALKIRNNRGGGSFEEVYSSALKAYTSGDDRKAEEILSWALGRDGLNQDILFLKANVALRMGKSKRARRLFRKCRDFDENGKWDWEIAELLRRM